MAHNLALFLAKNTRLSRLESRSRTRYKNLRPRLLVDAAVVCASLEPTASATFDKPYFSLVP